MTRIAIFPGSFDPPTQGHEDLIRRALGLVDRVIVAIAVNPAKQPLFPLDERLALLRAVTGPEPRIEITSFQGLLVDYARRSGAGIILRGLRAAGDFEYEMQMALMNRHQSPGLETVFLAPATNLTFLSSSLVREVAQYGGELGELVHPAVAAALRKRFAK
ncbi:MAG TPA: pantetheine-phosphate adenylyltransferase [Gemmatimonadales bacterium]|nr:pantetheine-phosphate adenylyltransferase [Gemmatimonadales bacterium]